MKVADRIALWCTQLGATTKSLSKISLLSRSVGLTPTQESSNTLIIMGNGPSLANTIRNCRAALDSYPLMAVNFAALADEFNSLRPEYYVAVDPHFFSIGNSQVDELWCKINAVKHQMTLIVPRGCQPPVDNANVRIEHINMVAAEGFNWFERMAFNARLGMPRPRNVLVPSIMSGIWLGFKQLYIVGADHSWTKTLSVDNDNTVVSIQPHFYKESSQEQKRVQSVYRDIKLHEVLDSMRIAFKSYHIIERYACSRGVDIFNSTPESFIDAFRRRQLPL